MSWIELVAQRRPPQPPAGMQPPENAKDWFRVTNSAENPEATDVLIYDSIGGWFGLYADEFVDALNQINTPKINLRLNSPGGSVFEGITVANALRAHPASVTVYVDGIAASIASVIAMAGERLVMMPQSQLMVHNASGACYGDATEMTKMADLLDKQSRNIAEAYAQHTGRPLAEWQDYMAAETWFTAEEAAAVGLADEVVPMKSKQPETTESEPVPAEAHMRRTWDLSMYAYAGRDGAPAPKIAQAVTMSASEQAVAEHAQRPDAVTAAAPTVEPKTITVDLSVLGADERFQSAIRDLIRQEIAAQAPQDAPPAAAPEDTVQLDDSPAAPPTPDDAFPPPPDEDEEEGDGEDPPPDEEDEPTDQADDWTSVVGLLVSPTSPSADDVFAQLKEGW